MSVYCIVRNFNFRHSGDSSFAIYGSVAFVIATITAFGIPVIRYSGPKSNNVAAGSRLAATRC